MLVFALAAFAVTVHCVRADPTAGVDHQVIVGGDAGLVFTPSTVTAAVGDTVTFFFHAENHTVTRSSFESPCTMLMSNDVSNPGFDSGFIPIAANATTFPNFTLTVNNTDPIWGYCRQVGHCSHGMVFAINPPTSNNTFQAFQSAALNDLGSASPAISSSAGVATASATASAAKSINCTGLNHIIKVGGDAGLVYTPNTLNASVCDKITFQFGPENHTITQSTFDSPCSPLSNGFNSGFMPVSNTTSNATSTTPEFTITVNDTNPIWAYCQQNVPASHCHAGMVLGINTPSTGNTIEAFREKALSDSSPSASSSSAAPSMTGATTSGVSAVVERVGRGVVTAIVGTTLMMIVLEQ